MEKTFENDYLTFEIDTQKSIFLYTWKPLSENLTSEDFVIEARKILEAILNSKCDFIIGNDTEFYFSITPDIQEQVNNEMVVLLNGVIKKFIHIYSKQFISQLSVEQLFEENTDATFQDIFVGSLNEAFKHTKISANTSPLSIETQNTDRHGEFAV